MIWFPGTVSLYQMNISTICKVWFVILQFQFGFSKKKFQCCVSITELLYRTAKRKKRKKFKDNWLTWSKNFKIIEVLWFSLKYWLSIRKIVTNSYLVSRSLVLGFIWIRLMPWEELHFLHGKFCHLQNI